MHRTKISLYGKTAHESVEMLKGWRSDCMLLKDTLAASLEDCTFFLTPGAYTRIFGVQHLLEGTNLRPNFEEGEDKRRVGTMFGIQAHSPIFLKDGLRDLQGLSDFQIEFRVMEPE